MKRIVTVHLSAPGVRLVGALATLVALQSFVFPTRLTPPAPVPTPQSAEPTLVAPLDPRTPLPDEARRWVNETLATLDVSGKAGQVLMVRAFGEYYAADAGPREELTGAVRDLGLGGVILFRSEAYEAAALTADLQAVAVDAGLPPLLIAADFEWGAEFRVGGAVPYPTAMAIGAAADPAAAEWMGRASGRDARALGIHWIFAPVADVNVNPRNPVINVRSFGEDPDNVGALAAAFVRGAQEAGVLATAKHFPGHGDTAMDSHIDLPVLRVDSQRLQAVELAPFRAAIDAGVGSIMTAHLAVPALTADESLPATLSEAVLTDLLRRQLDFEGLVVTDAMEMGGINRHWWSGQAAVRALQAGADMVLLPPFPKAVHAAIVRAVESGELETDRLDEAVRSVLEVKARLGLQHRAQGVPLDRLPERFAPVTDAGRARDIAAAAVTLLRDRRGVLPLDARRPPRVLVVGVSDSTEPVDTGVLVRELRERLGSVSSRGIDARTSGDEAADLVAEAARADVILLAVRVRVRSYQENIRLPNRQQAYASMLARLEAPVVVVALGSPYVVAAFPEASAAVSAYGWSDPLQEAAAMALTGESGWRGTLPVTVPGLYPIGHGVERPGLDATLRVPPSLAAAAAAGDASSPGDAPSGAPSEAAAGTGEAEDRPAGRQEAPGEAAPSAATDRVPRVLDETPLRSEDLEAARQAIERHVAAGAFPGAVWAVGHRNVLVALEAAGRMSNGPDAAPMPPDAVFDLASVTKVVATTSVAMRAVEDGRLRLDHPVRALVPEFAGDGKDAVTVAHLLTHTSGLPAYVRYFLDYEPSQSGAELRRTILERVFATPLEEPPGTRYAYSDLGIILLGEVLSRALGEPFEEVAVRDIFEPLGMTETRWNPPSEWLPRIPPTEEDPWRGRLVHGEVHDENAAAMGGVAPHAGLFSTARDLATFAQMMLNGGTYGHERVLGRGAIRAWTRRQNVVEGSSRALGWDTARPSNGWTMFSDSAYGHTGFTGTSIWIDPQRDLFVILLTNRVHPTRDNTLHTQARLDFHTAVVEAVDVALARAARRPSSRPQPVPTSRRGPAAAASSR